MDFQQLTGLIPHLAVKGGVAALEYYKKALGAEELSRMPTPDGRVMHATMKVEGSIFFLNDDFPEYCGGVSHTPSGPSPVTLHLCVKNCDAAIERAAKAGATVSMPATDMFWGDRYGQVTDPFGHSWSYGSPLTAEQKTAAEKAFAEQHGPK